MPKRTTQAQADTFRVDVDYILNNTRMPAAWLAELLGYEHASGLAMSRTKTRPSFDTYERCRELAKNLHMHIQTQKTQQGAAYA